MKTITTSLEIEASPEEIWETLIDFPEHQRWNPFFSRVEGNAIEGESIKITARKKDGSDGISFKPTLLEVKPGRVLRWKGKLFVRGLFDGEHTFRLEPLDERRTLLHHGENFSGILIPLMGKLLTETEAGFGDLNQALADEVIARRSTTTS